MKKVKLILAMVISSLLIGCNQVEETANKALAQAKKEIIDQIMLKEKEALIPVPEIIPEEKKEPTPVPEVIPEKKQELAPVPEVIPEKKQVATPVPTPTPNISNSNNNIGERKAKEIALSKVPNGVITEFSFDYDDYIPNYDISIRDSIYEYDFEINALDGRILEINKEYIDRDDD